MSGEDPQSLAAATRLRSPLTHELRRLRHITDSGLSGG
ncbi:hypothetical protein CyaNS01_01446 [Cyanobium sp. NS01]|nr:hypothetical protein CyaNS01_01446 [Cyanobium sp. NS01]